MSKGSAEMRAVTIRGLQPGFHQLLKVWAVGQTRALWVEDAQWKISAAFHQCIGHAVT